MIYQQFAVPNVGCAAMQLNSATKYFSVVAWLCSILINSNKMLD
jgi:hypothetical protein